jgi:hypothetical protein
MGSKDVLPSGFPEPKGLIQEIYWRIPMSFLKLLLLSQEFILFANKMKYRKSLYDAN